MEKEVLWLLKPGNINERIIKTVFTVCQKGIKKSIHYKIDKNDRKIKIPVWEKMFRYKN